MEIIDIAKLIDSIRNWKTWVMLIIVSIFGVLGSLTHKLTSPSADEISLLGYIVVGAVASIAVLFIIVPSDAVRLVALSLIVGYGGKAVLDASAAKMQAFIAKEETIKAKEIGKEAVDVGKEAVKQLEALMETRRPSEETPRRIPGGYKPPKDLTDKLGKLSDKLDSLEIKSQFKPK
ncbi:MAG TPA: hypothetical protein ACFYD6_09095 [Candidatus Brocadiia bacterium]|nr:hypothetical protein [Planctomycetota bacterium]MDO8094466.1 hypothetical protein [Candidatus Brocadiales bacterium]